MSISFYFRQAIWGGVLLCVFSGLALLLFAALDARFGAGLVGGFLLVFGCLAGTTKRISWRGFVITTHQSPFTSWVEKSRPLDK